MDTESSVISGELIIGIISAAAAVYAGIIAHLALYRESKLAQKMNKKDVKLEIAGILPLLLSQNTSSIVPYTVTVRNVGAVTVQVENLSVISEGFDRNTIILHPNKFSISEGLPVSLHPGEALICYMDYDGEIVQKFLNNGMFRVVMIDGVGQRFSSRNFFVDDGDPRVEKTRRSEQLYLRH